MDFKTIILIALIVGSLIMAFKAHAQDIKPKEGALVVVKSYSKRDKTLQNELGDFRGVSDNGVQEASELANRQCLQFIQKLPEPSEYTCIVTNVEPR